MSRCPASKNPLTLTQMHFELLAMHQAEVLYDGVHLLRVDPKGAYSLHLSQDFIP